MADERLIVALDFHHFGDVKNLVNELGDSVNFYKVGMELFYSVGIDGLDWLKSLDKKIFLDLKLCDIPNTTANGLCSLMNLGADIMNIHATGGYTMMKTAADKLREESARLGIVKPKLIAVTILTSINKDDWESLGYSAMEISAQVVRLAKLAKSAGVDGVVASPNEAKLIRENCGEDFLIITPGIRPAGADINDQSRIATPSAAIKNGANYLVVGRPITKADNPKLAAQKILDEIKEV